jgi:hypothetical protein
MSIHKWQRNEHIAIRTRVLLPVLLLLATFCVLGIYGLTRPVAYRAEDMQNGFTALRLQKWGDVLYLLRQSDSDRFWRSRSLEELIEWYKFIDANDALMIGPGEDFGRDMWKRPFYLELVITPTEKRLRIISLGMNGIYESGNGDDLYIECLSDPQDTSCSITLRAVSHGRIIMRVLYPSDEGN